MKKVCFFILVCFASQIAAQGSDISISAAEAELASWDSDGSDEMAIEAWNNGGFIELGLGSFSRAGNINEKNLSLQEIRGQIFANRYIGNHFFSLKVDGIVDNADEQSVRAEVRELFADFKLRDNVSLRLGQQVLTWGTGDFIFINDLFSKDWQSMFSGRDDNYLKKPDPAIKLSWFNPLVNVDLAWIPVFEGDKYINGERFSYYHPMEGTITHQRLQVENPRNHLDNSAFALRFSNSTKGTEYALYGYHGLYSQPAAFNLKSNKNIFPKMNAVGASVRTALAGGIANAEVAYWNFSDKDNESNPFIPNDQLNLLLGYEHEIAANVNLGGQYLVQKMQQYDQALQASPNPSVLVDKWHQTLTVRLNWLAMQQKMHISLFAFYSPDARDFYLKPKVSYRQDDHWFYELGANIFGGKHRHSQWGQFEDNTNIYARVKYHF